MLIDRIQTAQIANRPRCNLTVIKQWLLQSEVVLADNVATYFVETKGKCTLDDFPNIAPPFPFLFLEWLARRPDDDNHRSVAKTIGCLITSKEKATEPVPWKWECASVIFLEFTSGEIMLPVIFFWCVMEDGTPYFTEGKVGIKAFPPFENVAPDLLYELPIPWLTLSFMHCKNVELSPVLPSPKLSQARLRRGKRPLVTYKILKIRPMAKILDTEGKAQEIGLKKALHICRGHFKDYREGAGLFGRFHDIWWWDMHRAGSIDEGIALKDYLVNPE
ncbi:hypothetical protein ES703_87280 [subsurface metagenome]